MPQDTFRDGGGQAAEPSGASFFLHREMVQGEWVTLDSYPYSFSPLLLFAPEGYFDKGYSNYNAVAQFFSPVLEVDMLQNVLYDRKNMLYEELLAFVADHRMLVTCCIDSHFTAFQVLGDHALVYYDPLKSTLSFVNGPDAFNKFVAFLLLKCGYGDNGHIQDNKGHYMGPDASPVRRMIYGLWREINKLGDSPDALHGVRTRPIPLNLDRYLLVNDSRNPRNMSTQQTGNTCYFQVYLFAVLCKVGGLALAGDGGSVDVLHPDQLAEGTVRISRLLLEFFVQVPEPRTSGTSPTGGTPVMRPLTNANVVLDFARYSDACYYYEVTRYLRSRQLAVPKYEAQLARLLEYFGGTQVLHTYGKFALSGDMPSVPNTKSLQHVRALGDALSRLLSPSLTLLSPSPAFSRPLTTSPPPSRTPSRPLSPARAVSRGLAPSPRCATSTTPCTGSAGPTTSSTARPT